MSKLFTDSVLLAALVTRLAEAAGSDFVTITPTDLAALPLTAVLSRQIFSDGIRLSVAASDADEAALLFGPEDPTVAQHHAYGFIIARMLAVSVKEVLGHEESARLIHAAGYRTLAELSGNPEACRRLRAACIDALKGASA